MYAGLVRKRKSPFRIQERRIALALSKEYLLLFNALTDTENALARLCGDLLLIQQRAEELFLQAGEEQEETIPEA